MFYSAIVKNNVDNDLSGKIEVYIPTIMTSQDRNNSDITTNTTTSTFEIINSDISDSSYKTVKTKSANTIIAYPFSFTETNFGTQMIPEINDEVLVFFKDNNYNICYYMFGNAYKKDKKLNYGKVIEDEELSKDPEKYTKHKVLLLTNKNNAIAINDTDERNGVIIKASNKHKVHLQDNDSFSGIVLSTDGGQNIILDDTNKGISIKSSSGHSFFIDDTNGGINITSNNGSRLTIDDKKSIIQIVSANGIGLEFDDNNNKLRIDSQDTEITTKSSTKIESSSGSISNKASTNFNIESTNTEVKSKSSTKISTTTFNLNANGSIEIESNSVMNIKGSVINLEGQKINIGGNSATSLMVKGTELMTWLNTHIHSTAVGPSSPPTVPATNSILSTVGFVK